MKKILSLLILVCPAFFLAQDYSASIKSGLVYSHDFPGMNGYSAFVEYVRPLSNKLQAAVGIKRSNLSGFPRTNEVREFTRATAIDFNLYFVPVSNEFQELRVGAGYSFSFYNIRRSYPIVSNVGATPHTSWPIQDAKGRVSGIILLAEYEYFLPGTSLSI